MIECHVWTHIGTITSLRKYKENKPNTRLTSVQIPTADVGSRDDTQPSGRKRVEQPAEARRQRQRCRVQTDRDKRGVSLVACSFFQQLSFYSIRHTPVSKTGRRLYD